MSKIKDKTFMFTGRISVTRNEAQETVEELGGIAGSSVTRNTDYLVVGEDYGSKFTKAQILGVKCIDEDEFWAMVKEARALLPKEEVLLSREELENFGSISPEKWKYVFSQNPNLKILTELGLFCLIHKEDTVEEREDYPPVESMTYYSKENLEEWLNSGKRKPKLGSRICPYCGHEIPYSISNYFWFCFRCKLFSNPGQESGRHTCTDWKRLDISTERGFYENCKVCGNVKFVAFADVEELAKLDARCNYGHSLEFEAEVASIYAESDRISAEAREKRITEARQAVDQLSDERKEKLYSQFVRSLKSKEGTS